MRIGDALLQVQQGLVHDRTRPILQWEQVSRAHCTGMRLGDTRLWWQGGT